MSAVAKLIVVPEGGRGPFRYLASVDELKKTGQLTRWIDDHGILLYEYEGQIKALSNICRHFGGPAGYHKHKIARVSEMSKWKGCRNGQTAFSCGQKS